MIYPLSVREDRLVRWALRIMPTVAIVIILFLGAVSFASTQV